MTAELRAFAAEVDQLILDRQRLTAEAVVRTREATLVADSRPTRRQARTAWLRLGATAEWQEAWTAELAGRCEQLAERPAAIPELRRELLRWRNELLAECRQVRAIQAERVAPADTHPHDAEEWRG